MRVRLSALLSLSGASVQGPRRQHAHTGARCSPACSEAKNQNGDISLIRDCDWALGRPGRAPCPERPRPRRQSQTQGPAPGKSVVSVLTNLAVQLLTLDATDRGLRTRARVTRPLRARLFSTVNAWARRGAGPSHGQGTSNNIAADSLQVSRSYSHISYCAAISHHESAAL